MTLQDPRGAPRRSTVSTASSCRAVRILARRQGRRRCARPQHRIPTTRSLPGCKHVVIDVARALAGCPKSKSAEFDQPPGAVISTMPYSVTSAPANATMGGTMAGSASPDEAPRGDERPRRLCEPYAEERHRHRYEVTRVPATSRGFGTCFSGTSPERRWSRSPSANEHATLSSSAFLSSPGFPVTPDPAPAVPRLRRCRLSPRRPRAGRPRFATCLPRLLTRHDVRRQRLAPALPGGRRRHLFAAGSSPTHSMTSRHAGRHDCPRDCRASGRVVRDRPRRGRPGAVVASYRHPSCGCSGSHRGTSRARESPLVSAVASCSEEAGISRPVSGDVLGDAFTSPVCQTKPCASTSPQLSQATAAEAIRRSTRKRIVPAHLLPSTTPARPCCRGSATIPCRHGVLAVRARPNSTGWSELRPADAPWPEPVQRGQTDVSPSPLMAPVLDSFRSSSADNR